MNLLERKKAGQLIKHYRKKKGLKQWQLAEQVGINQATVAKIEAGNPKIHVRTVEHVADMLGLSAPVKGKGEVSRMEHENRELEAIRAELKRLREEMEKRSGQGSGQESESEPETPDLEQSLMQILEEFEDRGEEIGEWDRFWGSGKKQQLDKDVYVVAYQLAEQFGIDPHLKVSGGLLEEETSFAEAIKAVVVDYAMKEDPDEEKAIQELLDLFAEHGATEARAAKRKRKKEQKEAEAAQ